MLQEFWHNFTHNLFKPLLLFFYLGFLIPLFKVKFEFPKALYQSITIYLLVAIGWHGGEELASVAMEGGGNIFAQAAGFMLLGFCLNFVIGIVAYLVLKNLTSLRRIDAATVGGYYGSDSAGTFVTCMGVLAGLTLAAKEVGNLQAVAAYTPAPYMPVMLAVMEVPGCLVALFLVSALRRKGMDAAGNMPGEAGYQEAAAESKPALITSHNAHGGHHGQQGYQVEGSESNGGVAVAAPPRSGIKSSADHTAHNGNGAHDEPSSKDEPANPHADFNIWSVLHEVFFNPGLYLLFGGIAVGFISRLQGKQVTDADDPVFLTMFQGVLCLFLLEMGITACTRLRDLSHAGWRFVAFGLIAPNIFATTGIVAAHLYSHAIGQPMTLGTYVLFAVLCGAASYIAVPAVQRMAIPEASPTLPLAASLGLTFSWNVTIGIPIYLEIAKGITGAWPVVTSMVTG